MKCILNKSMEDAPLPTYITPKEKISESFEINQDENVYKLNIEIIDQNIILTLLNEKIMREYETTLTLDKLKQLHKIFLIFNSCQEFIDYMKALIENNKLSIKNISQSKICFEIMAEYLFKQNIIKIDLIKKEINFELIAQDLYKKISDLNKNVKILESNYLKVNQENIEIKEENKRLKEENNKIKDEIKLIKEEKKNKKEDVINLEGNELKKNYMVESEKNKAYILNLNLQLMQLKKELNNLKEENNRKFINVLEFLKKKDKIVNKKDESIHFRILSELLETLLIKIFWDDSQTINLKDKNDIKKIATAIFILNIFDLYDFFKNFVEKYFNNNLWEKKKLIIGKKKAEIYLLFEELRIMFLITKIGKSNAFIKELREKCGITEEDIKNDDITKEIKNNKYDKKKVVISILKKLKLLKKDD